jgi:drug/metabolite transporter (DMT)-like permease
MTASSRARLIGAFAAIYLMWGGTFLAIRFAVADIPPLMTMVLRCAGGALVLFTWLAWRGTLERPSRTQWLTAGVAGAFLFLGCHGLLAWAEQRISSGEAALLMTAIPLWLIALESIVLRRPPSRRVVLSLLLGVAGVAVLTWGDGWSGGITDRAVLLVSALFWAVGTLIVRHAGAPLPAVQSTAMQLGAGALVLLTASIAVGEPFRWSPAEVTPRASLALVFLILGGTVLGFGAYTWFCG